MGNQCCSDNQRLSAFDEKTNFIDKSVVFDAIVIGGGIAGVTSAYHLAKAGKKVLIVQANVYIGGRIKTTEIKLQNNQIFKFQEGANWIHGASKNNPIIQLSKQIQGVNLYQTDDQNLVVYDQKGKIVTKEVNQQWQQYENIQKEIYSKQNVSMYDAINHIEPSKLKNKYFMWSMANDVQFQTSAPIQKLSAEYGQNDSSFQGEDKIVLSGYQKFAQYLAKHSNIKVLVNHKITQVAFNGSTNTVECQNGQKFVCKNIVIAVPLGVLKSNSIHFKPQLTQWKKAAIQSLCVGNVCKILIKFNKNVKFQESENYIGLVDNNIDKRGAATYFLNLNSIAQAPTLMTFGLGPNSDELQFMEYKDLKKLILRRLRIIMSEDLHFEDFQLIRSNWRGNPNFGGAYTFSGINTKPFHWKDMAKPIFEQNWYFCGQHTYSIYRGTVHGAYLSGKSTAQDIKNKIRQKDWVYNGESNNS